MAIELTNASKNPNHAAPFAPINTKTMQAMTRLAEIFQQAVSEQAMNSGSVLTNTPTTTPLRELRHPTPEATTGDPNHLTLETAPIPLPRHLVNVPPPEIFNLS